MVAIPKRMTDVGSDNLLGGSGQHVASTLIAVACWGGAGYKGRTRFILVNQVVEKTHISIFQVFML